MGRKIPRNGYTTGACAAAAAKGAAMMLRNRELAGEAEIELPGGELARFSLQGQTLSQKCAACYVVKDAGDDPDVTNGVEVHAAVTMPETFQDGGEGACGCRVIIEGGRGIGRVTKPGWRCRWVNGR